jgi:hypothetical protein
MEGSVLSFLKAQFQRRGFFRNRSIRNKNCLWWPILLTDQEEMSNRYKGPFIDAFYQVLVHLAILYQDCSFHPDPITNMATTGNAFFY